MICTWICSIFLFIVLDVLQAIEKDGKKITPEGCKKGKRIRVVESSTREMQRAIDEIVHGPDVARYSWFWNDRNQYFLTENIRHLIWFV